MEAKELVRDMTDAYVHDNESNKNGIPALKKLLLIEDVSKQLKRQDLHDSFIGNGGLPVLATWLYQLPDNTYPN